MKYININAIEQIEIVHERIASYYKAHYKPEHINFWGKIIPEQIVYYEDKRLSVESFLEKYGNEYFIKDQQVYQKAYLLLRFSNGNIHTFYFSSNKEAEEKADEITKKWNRIYIS